VPISPFIAQYEQVILDLDGCVYLGDEAIPGSPEAIAALREAGKRVAFVTNNPRSSGEEYVRRLWGLGIQASAADVVTVGGAVQHLLAERYRGRTVFVVGTPALKKHVADSGVGLLNGSDLATRADVVVVGGTEDLVYEDLRVAALALRRGADFLVTGRDPTHPMPDGLWPGTGAIVAALEYATGRTAAVVGKPEAQLLVTALDRLGEGRTLVIGDRLDTDVAAAAKAHLDAALVLSGGTSAEEAAAARDPKPARVADDLRALVLADGVPGGDGA
jgi:HAD superfamily hydrolase (TIGR01450 family)